MSVQNLIAAAKIIDNEYGPEPEDRDACPDWKIFHAAITAVEEALGEKAEPCPGVYGGVSAHCDYAHCPSCNPTALRLAGELVVEVCLDCTLNSRSGPWSREVQEKARELKEALGG